MAVDKKGPALTPQQWKQLRAIRPELVVKGFGTDGAVLLSHMHPLDFAAAVAINNEMLAHDDTRKITREWITELHRAAGTLRNASRLISDQRTAEDHRRADRLDAMADALECYLSPDRV